MVSSPLPTVPPIYTEQAAHTFIPGFIIAAIIGGIVAVISLVVWNVTRPKPRHKPSPQQPLSHEASTRADAEEILLAYIPERTIRTATSYVIAPQRPVPDRGFPVHLFRPVSCTGHPYGQAAVYDDGLVLTYVDDVDEWVKVSPDLQLPNNG